MRTLLLLATLLLGGTMVAVGADVTLNGLFTDNMVLQRGIEVPVWGFAEPGEELTVLAAGQSVSATADADGRWRVRLDPVEVEGPFEMTVRGRNEIVLRNVVMGEVWICSGQSNMAWPVSRSLNAEDEIATAELPLIRLCQVQRTTATEPAEQVAANWVECSPETVGAFSAVAYFFGRRLHEELGVPVGLINTSWGGTPAEAWTSADRLLELEFMAPIYEWWESAIDAHPAAMDRYHEETLPAWEARAEAAREAGETPPRRPQPPPGANHHRRPSNLFNAMIHPLIPFAVRGVIWYQGEANASGGGGGRSGAWRYRQLFPALIEDWRERWGRGDFHFGWVQLANFRAVVDEPAPSAWAELRESQSLTLALPKTGMALAIDCGEADDIHPRDKQTVGERLALWALDDVHGLALVSQGPIYSAMEIEGPRLRLTFGSVEGGLEIRATENVPGGGGLRGFQVAGEDRQWHWAEAELDADTVLVWAGAVGQPVAVRYAWADNPVANLYNHAGLPAVPFRTDDWPLSTEPGEQF